MATRKDLPPKVPTVNTKPFPIVGIGASAGGLVAFEAFFLECLFIQILAWLLLLCSIWLQIIKVF